MYGFQVLFFPSALICVHTVLKGHIKNAWTWLEDVTAGVHRNCDWVHSPLSNMVGSQQDMQLGSMQTCNFAGKILLSNQLDKHDIIARICLVFDFSWLFSLYNVCTVFFKKTVKYGKQCMESHLLCIKEETVPLLTGNHSQWMIIHSSTFTQP